MTATFSADEFRVVDTQKADAPPPTGEQAVAMMHVPPGFSVTLFAAEPDIRQPIAMAFDSRGRLWVAENYTYAEREVNFAKDHRDRIVILEDADHDGKADRRTIFWDKCQKLTAVELGFGGVWALCAPQLLFVPDKNGDDIPDGEPVVVLDGWDDDAVRHNIVNGLRWGPDGWLYGRHGILTTSLVGRPGTPRDLRTRINCGIWRYHPTRCEFEVVAHGTTNPWGLDYDDYGEMFFSNTVIGHLWHVIPGAHYKRMYGEDLDPHTYELIDQHADHYHWDTGKKWFETREAVGETDQLGGGHAHCGLMIYLGDNWPDHYRNTLFTCNLHGRRLNNDRHVRSGSGFVARHDKDFLNTTDRWFRGIELAYGPDGGVFVLDWSDVGECHENDGVHRNSGRIFKVAYGKPKPPPISNLAALTDRQLAGLQSHRNDWYVRTARRILQERAAGGKDMLDTKRDLDELFARQSDPTRKLRALWAIHAIDGADKAWLLRQLDDPSEHVRAWAVRLLGDSKLVEPATVGRLAEMAGGDKSGLVRLYLASTLQRLPVRERNRLALALASRTEDATDHNVPLMIWYGIEPFVASDSAQAAVLLAKSASPLVRRLIARRVAEEIETRPDALDAIVVWTSRNAPDDMVADVLLGMNDALRGWQKAQAPAHWAELKSRLSTSGRQIRPELARDLSVIFGDGRTIVELRRIAEESTANPEARRAALRALTVTKSDHLVPVLNKLLADRATAAVAAAKLADYDYPDTPRHILEHYHLLGIADRVQAVNTLTSRPAYARRLLDAVESGVVTRDELSAYHARQIQSFGDAALTARLTKIWGEVRATPEEKMRLIANVKQTLSAPRLLQASRSNGRMLFDKHCVTCHRLFGEGHSIGPDLTGSNRDNVDYLLENVIDPGATVARDYRLSIIVFADGRVVTGVIGATTTKTITVQTQNERLTIDRALIDDIRATENSLMPDGLLSNLSNDQIVDLVAYLMSRQQVAAIRNLDTSTSPPRASP